MYPIDRQLVLFLNFYFYKQQQTCLCASPTGDCTERRMPEPGCRHVSLRPVLPSFLPSTQILPPTMQETAASPHPPYPLALLDCNFRHCEMVSLRFDFNLRQPDYYSLAHLPKLLLRLFRPPALGPGCSYLCLFFSLVVYLFPC